MFSRVPYTLTPSEPSSFLWQPTLLQVRGPGAFMRPSQSSKGKVIHPLTALLGPPARGLRGFGEGRPVCLPALVLRWQRTCLQCRRPGFDPWDGTIPWRRAWQPTPVFLPGESQGQRSLADCSPRGCKESDTTERLSAAQASLQGWGGEGRRETDTQLGLSSPESTTCHSKKRKKKKAHNYFHISSSSLCRDTGFVYGLTSTKGK